MTTLLSIILLSLTLYTIYYNWTELRMNFYLGYKKNLNSTKFKIKKDRLYRDGVKIMKDDNGLYKWFVKYPHSKRLKICDELKKEINNDKNRNNT